MYILNKNKINVCTHQELVIINLMSTLITISVFIFV